MSSCAHPLHWNSEPRKTKEQRLSHNCHDSSIRIRLYSLRSTFITTVAFQPPTILGGRRYSHPGFTDEGSETLGGEVTHIDS